MYLGLSYVLKQQILDAVNEKYNYFFSAGFLKEKDKTLEGTKFMYFVLNNESTSFIQVVLYKKLGWDEGIVFRKNFQALVT